MVVLRISCFLSFQKGISVTSVGKFLAILKLLAKFSKFSEQPEFGLWPVSKTYLDSLKCNQGMCPYGWVPCFMIV